MSKLIKLLYGLKKALKQWQDKIDEFILSNGFIVNQVDKCVYNKFDEQGQGEIICLYVSLGTNIVHVEMARSFLSSSFSKKDIGEVYVILGIKIIKDKGRLILSLSHYIEKILI